MELKLYLKNAYENNIEKQIEDKNYLSINS